MYKLRIYPQYTVLFFGFILFVFFCLFGFFFALFYLFFWGGIAWLLIQTRGWSNLFYLNLPTVQTKLLFCTMCRHSQTCIKDFHQVYDIKLKKNNSDIFSLFWATVVFAFFKTIENKMKYPLFSFFTLLYLYTEVFFIRRFKGSAIVITIQPS